MSKKNIDHIKSQLATKPENYAASKIHAEQLDKYIGYKCEPIEEILFEQNKDSLFSSPRQFWYGLELQTLQTPYSELVEMMEKLNPQPGETWIDLGAGYGRMGIVLGCLHPQVQFVGYEYVALRVDEGNRIYQEWGFDQAKLVVADLAKPEFSLPTADLYFVYDFGSQDDIYKLLEKLRIVAQKKSVRVIARGRGVRNWILMDFPWLYDIQPPQHFATWTLFRS